MCSMPSFFPQEKMKKMTPEQRTRYEEKKRKKQMKGQFRVKMM